MAGAGYKLFNTGDVLTAAQVNTYLQQQVIMVFADSSARTTALSGVLAEGMFSYLTGTNAFQYYDGAAWADVSNPGDITGVTAGTGLSGGGSSGAVTLSIDTATTADLTTAQTLTNKTLTAPILNDATANYSTLKAPTETANVIASAATGTINIDVETSTVWYYTTNATANHTLNFRYNSGTTLSSKLSVGEVITIIWITPNGATPYYPNVIQIDGSTVTPKLQGGTAISGGNASATDIYSFTIIKTAATPTYLVLESQTKFA
jgi:hypothetical protein